MKKKTKNRTKVFWAFAGLDYGCHDSGWMLVGWPTKKAAALVRADNFDEGEHVGPLFQIEVPIEPIWKKGKTDEVQERL